MNVQTQAFIWQTVGQLLSAHLETRQIQKKVSAEESIRNFIDESDQRMKAVLDRPVSPAPQLPVRQTVLPTEANPVYQGEEEVKETKLGKKAESIVSGCIPCSLGHYTTCSGLLNEAVRFSHNGLADPEVVDRVTMCLGELNALERVDLRPEMILDLSGPEQDMAQRSLNLSRHTRHKLEGMNSPDDLIEAAANLQKSQKILARDWFKHKLQHLTPEDQEEINRRLQAKLKEIQEEGE